MNEKSEYSEYLKWAGRAAAKCRIVEKATYALAAAGEDRLAYICLLYTSPSPRD